MDQNYLSSCLEIRQALLFFFFLCSLQSLWLIPLIWLGASHQIAQHDWTIHQLVFWLFQYRYLRQER